MQRIKWRALGAASIGVISIDRIVTIQFWAYETNPIVTQLGVSQWVALTSILITALLLTIESERLAVWESVAGWASLLTIIVMHVVVIVANGVGLWTAGVVSV